MILVTGTKRSGTSMWMQILRAAGFPVLGEAFPKDWGETIRDANPEGFYESPLRNGIYHATNPSPRTGAYLHPSDTRSIAVKVFVPGLVRSDLAYVDKVIACVRDHRAYPGSLARLYEMEQTNRAARLGKALEALPTVPPLDEWWADNFALLADSVLRRYPVHFVAYENVLREPERVVREALTWLGVTDGAALEAACAIVKPTLTTQQVDPSVDPEGLDPAHARVFDGLYARVRDRLPFEDHFIETLNALEDEIGPRIDRTRAAVMSARRAARRKRKPASETA